VGKLTTLRIVVSPRTSVPALDAAGGRKEGRRRAGGERHAAAAEEAEQRPRARGGATGTRAHCGCGTGRRLGSRQHNEWLKPFLYALEPFPKPVGMNIPVDPLGTTGSNEGIFIRTRDWPFPMNGAAKNLSAPREVKLKSGLTTFSLRLTSLSEITIPLALQK